MICFIVHPKNLLCQHNRIGGALWKELNIAKTVISMFLNYNLTCDLLTKQSRIAVKVLSCNISLMRLRYDLVFHK